MPTGILKYKQDDGSIAELVPAGFVTQTTYDAGQAAQDGRLDALENTHHYANLEEALKDKGRGGYLDIQQENANFIFNPSTVSKDATVTYKNNVTLRIQLPRDSVIDDTTTVPTGEVMVCPHFSYRRNPDNSYMTTDTYYGWNIVACRYVPTVHCVDLVLAPVDTDIPFIPVGDTPLSWKFTAYL